MPELPEVEHGRRVVEAVARGRRIRRVECAADPIVFEGVPPERWRRALEGRRVLGVGRHGKHVWLELDGRPWPLFHLGMTGAFRVPGDSPLPLASSGRHADRTWPPRFTRIRLILDDGGELAMTNARRLGRLRLRQDPRAEPPLDRLGFDPLHGVPSAARLRGLLAGRRARLKTLLLDQTFAAGVGNWMADEILYQARLDPRRPAGGLADGEVQRLGRKLAEVTRRAVAVDADKERFPRTWLFHHRWGRRAGARTARGEAIEFLRVGGRTTAWVPSVQT